MSRDKGQVATLGSGKFRGDSSPEPWVEYERSQLLMF